MWHSYKKCVRKSDLCWITHKQRWGFHLIRWTGCRLAERFSAQSATNGCDEGVRKPEANRCSGNKITSRCPSCVQSHTSRRRGPEEQLPLEPADLRLQRDDRGHRLDTGRNNETHQRIYGVCGAALSAGSVFIMCVWAFRGRVLLGRTKRRVCIQNNASKPT